MTDIFPYSGHDLRNRKPIVQIYLNYADHLPSKMPVRLTHQKYQNVKKDILQPWNHPENDRRYTIWISVDKFFESRLPDQYQKRQDSEAFWA